MDRPDDIPPEPTADTFDPRCVPVLGGRGVHPVPDLSKIPREHWRAVLRMTHRSVRERAARTAMRIDLPAAGHATALMIEVDCEETAARERAQSAAAWPRELPRPRAERQRKRRSRQLNIRLSVDEHAALQRATDLLGLRPTEVARMLVVRGVHQVLREAEREVG
jgi:hypothetical protein